MIVYRVMTPDDTRYFRNKAQAIEGARGWDTDEVYIVKVEIPTPITKELAVAMLNGEGFAVTQEDVDFINNQAARR